MPARQLSANVWMVGSGTDELALTNPHDCHCYLVWDGVGGVLVDVGTGLSAERWMNNIREVCNPSALRGVVLTHYHGDHAGGAYAAQDAGLRILASSETAHALAKADEERTSLARARAAGLYPEHYRLLPATVDEELSDRAIAYTSDRIHVEVLNAPGHCDGHVVALMAKSGERGGWLFSGDCLFAGGKVSIQALPDCRLDLYASTVIRLAEHHPEAVLPGHGELVLDGAWRDITDSAASFAHLVPPRNILSP